MMFARPLLSRAMAVLTGVLMMVAAVAAEAQSSYRIQAGDTLRIEVLEDSALNRSALVLPDGTISFPFIGTLRVAGSSVSAVRTRLAEALAPNFAAEPTVVVSVGALAPKEPQAPAEPEPDPVIDVYAMGEIATPGRLEVAPGTTILQFLAEAGGPTPFAARSRIELHRTDPLSGRTTVYLFSYDGSGGGPRILPGTVLADGDVVVVPARRLFE